MPTILKIRSFYNTMAFATSSSNEKGFLMKFQNRSGGDMLKGRAVSLLNDEYDRINYFGDQINPCIGIVAEDTISDNAFGWIWVKGSLCQVFLPRDYAEEGSRFDWVLPIENSGGLCRFVSSKEPYSSFFIGKFLDEIRASGEGLKMMYLF